MPTYQMKCQACGEECTHRMTFGQYDDVKGGNPLPCTCCEGGRLGFVFAPGGVGFVLRDGAAGGWMTKADRERKYRTQRAVVMAQKERDHVFKNRLVPNLGGQEAHSWADVRDEVRHQKGEAAASTYDSFVTVEEKRS